MTLSDWTPAHSHLAQSEGWDLFSAHGTDRSAEIARLDTPSDFGVNMEPLAGDDVAWRIVKTKAAQGSALHLHALAIISQVEPKEYGRIITA